ncbi:MAG: hypothetical protein IJ632_05860 [Muribaculaceae bacterium]|nr:hypothetical protein [Muribaculaceae bacterium]MBR1551829.1 hypothetical protein [Muribaculaceae bacterium]
MRTIVVCAVLLLAGVISAQAEGVYPDSVLCEDYGIVNYKGKAPSIVDFVTALQDPEEHPEFWGEFYDAWHRYLRGRSPRRYERLTVDRQHGYVFYDRHYQDDDMDSRGCLEYCYWNCADGKHKIVAESLYFLYNGRASAGQYDGVQFFLYDNDTHVMKRLLPEGLGIDTSWGVTWDYNDDNTVTLYDLDASQPRLMPRADFDEWLMTSPYAVYHLPREGKDINVTIYTAGGQEQRRLVWDGWKFTVAR